MALSSGPIAGISWLRSGAVQLPPVPTGLTPVPAAPPPGPAPAPPAAPPAAAPAAPLPAPLPAPPAAPLPAPPAAPLPAPPAAPLPAPPAAPLPAPPPTRPPRSSPGPQPTARSSQPASDCQRASCPAVTAPELGAKTLSSTFDISAARRTSAARSRVPPTSDSSAIRPSNSAASSGWRCTIESTETCGFSSAVGRPMSSTTARLADSKLACSSWSKRRARSRQYRTWRRFSWGSTPGFRSVTCATAFRRAPATPTWRRWRHSRP